MYLARNSFCIALAILGYLGVAHLAHGAPAKSPAAAADGGVCTSKTTVQADGTIVIHKVCTYTLR